MPLLCDFIEHELELFHMNIRVSYRIPVVLVHAEIGFTQDEQHNYMSALFYKSQQDLSGFYVRNRVGIVVMRSIDCQKERRFHFNQGICTPFLSSNTSIATHAFAGGIEEWQVQSSKIS